ncbi:MAG: histidine phosphatase family protein [bacterium]|nr:histidine phosphatase family protein [bacterium]
MKLLFARHAEMQGDPYACPPPPVHGCLSARGAAQALRAQRAMAGTRIDAALVSPYGRAVETAQVILQGRALTPHLCDFLREWLPNDALRQLPAEQHAEVMRRHEHTYVEEQWKTELGEGCFDMYARICPPFLAALRAHGIHRRMGGFVLDPPAHDMHILVVAHGGTLNVLLCFLLGLPPFPLGQFAFELTGLATLVFIEQMGIFYPQLVIPAAADTTPAPPSGP